VVEDLEFFVGSPPNDGGQASVRSVDNMPAAVSAHRAKVPISIRFDLGRSADMMSPLYDHQVLGHAVTTNNTAGFLASVARRTWLVDGGSRHPFDPPRAVSLDEMEVAVLEAAALTFGRSFLEALAVGSARLRGRRTERLQLLRCLVRQMKRNTELEPLAVRLDGAIRSTNVARFKHAGF
jgi:hypothetical protein